jgi:glycosyltransferase involved in cell wall biosynthesis
VTISLCIIAGNEAAHIARMLNSFSAAFDELSLVRAIGATEPDATESIAREWCEQHGKKLTFADYRNDPLNANWPHVDDFAAARNQSFSQATGDWLFWADCDDVISDAAALRQCLTEAPADLAMIRFPYHVPHASKTTQRERAIRAATFRSGRVWRWPVHENMLVDPSDKWVNRAEPIWHHEPVGTKAGGDQRNLRILTSALRDAPTNYYYCHQENFHLKNREQSRRFGELFLALPGGNPAMRYQCHINLCEMAELKDEASRHALQAHNLYPRHKEAIAALVKCAFQDESPERALHWSKLLVDTESPPLGERLWCYEPKWDDWAGLDLRARALRYAGKGVEARAVEAMIQGGKRPKFSLIHATRGRVPRAVQCREMWLELAANPRQVEHLFAIDADDKQSNRWLRSFKHVISGEPNCINAWNTAAAVSTGEILIQLSDDWAPPRHWDRLLLDVIGQRDPMTEQFVIAVDDGHRKDNLLCMAILSRMRYLAQGSALFSPEYEGVFSDNEFSHRAYRDGVVIEARHLTFNHAHPVFGAGQWDDTYKRQNAPEKYQRGLETFNRRNPEAAIIA